MRYILALVLCLCWTWGLADEWEDRQFFGIASARETLRVLSSTDTALFAPLLDRFTQANPGVAVDYHVAGTAQIDDVVREGAVSFDVVISSAMDLQFKLANDGFARAVPGIAHPAWAQWRSSLFAFTSEPAAIVLNRAAFEGYDIPQTRQDLIRALRARPEFFHNRVGTYDVRQSGLGYFFATQDARTSETFWRLMEVMGNLDTQLYCCSGDMIGDVAEGTIAVAYNVLGSYAEARTDLAGLIAIVKPTDFETTMMRTAFVSSGSSQADVAAGFIAYLLAQRRDEPITLPLLEAANMPLGQFTIQLEPALLTYLDRLKRQRFLAEWGDAVFQ